MMVELRNPFRNPMIREQYDALVAACNTKNKDLIRPAAGGTRAVTCVISRSPIGIAATATSSGGAADDR